MWLLLSIALIPALVFVLMDLFERNVCPIWPPVGGLILALSFMAPILVALAVEAWMLK